MKIGVVSTKNLRSSLGLEPNTEEIELNVFPFVHEDFYTGNQINFLPREKVEEDPNWQQLITYVVAFEAPSLTTGPLINILMYERKDGDQRLTGAKSIGVGGHLEEKDLFNVVNPFFGFSSLDNCARREWEEGTGHSWRGDVKITQPIAIIHGGSKISRYYTGIIFYAHLKEGLEIKTGEVDGKFMTIPQILSDSNDNLNYEPWSRKLLNVTRTLTNWAPY